MNLDEWLIEAKKSETDFAKALQIVEVLKTALVDSGYKNEAFYYMVVLPALKHIEEILGAKV
jgi:hypothetical protein